MAEAEEQVMVWIEEVIGRKVNRPLKTSLKDGIILCELINKLKAGSVKRVKEKGTPFQLRENIAAFQEGVKKYGVPEEDIFQTVDLFEAKNIVQVVRSLMALGRTAQKLGFDGPVLGPKMSTECKRNFTEEQNRKGRDAQIGLQAGQNKGATAAGVSMGASRHM